MTLITHSLWLPSPWLPVSPPRSLLPPRRRMKSWSSAAHGWSKNWKMSPAPISVITAKQIEEQVVTNVADLFRYEPGVTVNGGSHSATDGQTFSLRGMGGNRVKVVSDGVRQNDAYGEGGVGQNYFDTDMIKQVEIVKGPASTAYGSDAIGGVIAITTKDASDFFA